MEDKIEVGEYVRTLNGNISKVLSIRKKSSFRTNTGHISTSPERYFVDDLKQYSISKPYVKKHSKNIIDLIEVGDYVNGWKVLSIVTTLDKPEEISFKFLGFDNLLFDINIKSIVTKEMFASAEYRVETD